jgi:hypothetical protein
MVNVFMRLCFLLGWVAVGQLLRLADCRTGNTLFVKNAMGFVLTYDTLNPRRDTRSSAADPSIDDSPWGKHPTPMGKAPTLPNPACVRDGFPHRIPIDSCAAGWGGGPMRTPRRSATLNTNDLF